VIYFQPITQVDALKTSDLPTEEQVGLPPDHDIGNLGQWPQLS